MDSSIFEAEIVSAARTAAAKSRGLIEQADIEQELRLYCFQNEQEEFPVTVLDLRRVARTICDRARRLGRIPKEDRSSDLGERDDTRDPIPQPAIGDGDQFHYGTGHVKALLPDAFDRTYTADSATDFTQTRVTGGERGERLVSVCDVRSALRVLDLREYAILYAHYGRGLPVLDLSMRLNEPKSYVYSLINCAVRKVTTALNRQTNLTRTATSLSMC